MPHRVTRGFPWQGSKSVTVFRPSSSVTLATTTPTKTDTIAATKALSNLVASSGSTPRMNLNAVKTAAFWRASSAAIAFLSFYRTKLLNAVAATATIASRLPNKLMIASNAAVETVTRPLTKILLASNNVIGSAPHVPTLRKLVNNAARTSLGLATSAKRLVAASLVALLLRASGVIRTASTTPTKTLLRATSALSQLSKAMAPLARLVRASSVFRIPNYMTPSKLLSFAVGAKRSVSATTTKSLRFAISARRLATNSAAAFALIGRRFATLALATTTALATPLNVGKAALASLTMTFSQQIAAGKLVASAFRPIALLATLTAKTAASFRSSMHPIPTLVRVRALFLLSSQNPLVSLAISLVRALRLPIFGGGRWGFIRRDRRTDNIPRG